MTDPRDAHLQWGKSRDVAWDAVLDGHLSANTFLLKSALTRKADLARTLARHRDAAGPDAPAVRAAPETIVIDPDDDDPSDAEEEVKDECSGCSGCSGSGLGSGSSGSSRVGLPPGFASRGGRWALKASDGNRGENIVFLDAESPADLARAERVMRADGDTAAAAWVLQRYVEPPMLRRGVYKFHLRAHVLAVGDLDVWVHDEIVALCAATPYRGASTADARAHATNLCARRRREKNETAYAETRKEKEKETKKEKEKETKKDKEAETETEAEAIATLEELCASVPLPTSRDGSAITPEALATRIRARIRDIVADLFLAARGRAGGALGFFPTAGGFELFGLDFLLDADGDARLLEVNSDPSLAVFGERLEERCARMLADVLDVALPEVRRARGGDVEADAESTRRGGFARVARLPPRFAGDVDGAVGRRKLAALVSVAGAIARGDAAEGDVGTDGKPRRRRVAFALGGSKGAVGARRALERAGWRVESSARDAPECAFQWAPHGSIRWDRVMEETRATRATRATTDAFATTNGFATTANHHFARAGLTRRGEKDEERSRSESGWRRARAFALVAGAKPRVELRRGSFAGLSAEEAEEARPAVADAVVRALDAAKANSGFLPFRNCFEVYATTLDVRRGLDGTWEARAARFEDAFGSPSGGADGAIEEESEADSALAEDAVVAALEFFFPDETRPTETSATRGFEVVRA